jgi:dTDP-glucose 4,6-dehydratase
MNILVTGGSGFIGSNFVEYALEKGHDVTNLSKHTYASNPYALKHLEGNPSYHFMAADITDPIAVSIAAQKKDAIVHFAAETHVDRSFTYPKDFFEVNTLGTFTILEVLRRMDHMPRVVCMSTDEVLGEVLTGQSIESDPINPRNPYSASKAAAEAFAKAYYYSYNVPVVILRATNNYGPRQHPEKLIAKIITRTLANKPFTLYEGDAVRDWLFVRDTCQAVELLLDKGKAGQTYHIGTPDHRTVKEVAETILDIMGKSELLAGFKGRRLQDDERYSLDWGKIRETLGWRPQTSFESGVRATIDWFRGNEWFWRHFVDTP